MPDISLCHKESAIACPISEKCYRATANPSPLRQSYFIPDNIGNDCEYFWDNRDGETNFK